MNDNKIKTKLKFKYTSRLLQGCSEVTESDVYRTSLLFK